MSPRLEPNQILHGDCREILKTFPDASVDSVVTDPPAGISFMGRTWDDPGVLGVSGGVAMPATTSSRNPSCRNCGGRKRAGDATKACECAEPDWNDLEYRLKDRQAFVDFIQEVMTECYRILKPGGHMFVWALPRTSHWTAMAIENAGFEIRDCIYHVFGCLSEDTEMLTERGWEPYHTLEEGRLALCYDAEHGGFTWQPIQQVYLYPYRDTAYRLHGDHTDQVVSRNHRCLVERGGAFVFEYAEEVARERQARVPVLEDVLGLLRAVPLPHQGAGNPQSDVLARLLGQEHQRHQVGARSDHASSDLQGMWGCVPAQEQCFHEAGEVLQHEVFGSNSGDQPNGTGTTQDHRQAWTYRMDGGKPGVLHSQDDGFAQSCVEGRGDLFLEARELRLGEVRSVSTRIPADGSKGRVRGRASSHRGDGGGQVSHADGDGASHQSRSYKQRGDELDAVRFEPGAQVVRGARFTTTDLVRVEPVQYDGIVWCVRVPTGAFVARRAGKAFITGNSGFPKSLNVSKAIVKMARGAPQGGRDPEKSGRGGIPTRTALGMGGGTGKAVTGLTNEYEDFVPVTEGAKKWDGWGTALKPAVECWWLCRKPIEGTSIAFNVLRHGTGAINIDGTRISAESSDGKGDEPVPPPASPAGRWPSNLMLSHGSGCRQIGTTQVPAPVINRFDDGMKPFGDGAGHPYTQSGGGMEDVPVFECEPGCPIKALDEQSGELTSAIGKPSVQKTVSASVNFNGKAVSDPGRNQWGDSGGASRFFKTFDQGRWPANIVLSHAPECVRKGTRKVRGGNDPRRKDGTARSLNHGGEVYGDGISGGVVHPSDHAGFSDDEGMETVDDYECVSGCPIAEMDRQGAEMGIHKAGSPLPAQERWDMTVTPPGYGSGFSGPSGKRYGDDGGASRFFQNLEPDVPFFYTGKASRSDKNDGLEEMPMRAQHQLAEQTISTQSNRRCRKCDRVKFGQPHCECEEPDWAETVGSKGQNHHPTVKSTKLMRYLVKMITPKGGLVLDPFTGSGSTLIAAVQEGMQYVGIEQEADYLEIAKRRVGVAAERAGTKQAERDIFDLMMSLGDD